MKNKELSANQNQIFLGFIDAWKNKQLVHKSYHRMDDALKDIHNKIYPECIMRGLLLRLNKSQQNLISFDHPDKITPATFDEIKKCFLSMFQEVKIN